MLIGREFDCLEEQKEIFFLACALDQRMVSVRSLGQQVIQERRDFLAILSRVIPVNRRSQTLPELYLGFPTEQLLRQ